MSKQKVGDFILSAPKEFQPTLKKLNQLIRKSLPGCTVKIPRFPVYTDDGKWIAGFAWKKRCPMLYIMSYGVLDDFADQLGKLRTGKSCVEYRETKDMPIQSLEGLVREMLDETARRLEADS